MVLDCEEEDVSRFRDEMTLLGEESEISWRGRCWLKGLRVTTGSDRV